MDDGSGPHRAQHELGDFLRSRRGRITPDDLGLPTRGRRRTPGLRREEVAQLAGVGVTWYTWLEQGRDVHPSEQVLHAIARALRLDPDERDHLARLGGFLAPNRPATSDQLDPAVVRLLDSLNPFPAYVQNARFDLVGYNTAFRHLIHDLDAVGDADQNVMWLAFTDPAWQQATPDWSEVTARMVAQLRSQPDGPHRQQLVDRLSVHSSRFVELWRRHGVVEPRVGHKTYLSPRAGRLHFDVVTMWLQPRAGLRMLSHIPADDTTAGRLPRLIEGQQSSSLRGPTIS